MDITNLKIITDIKEELSRIKQSKEYFSKATDFTRDSKFTFETVFFMIADLPRKTLSVEITKGLKIINELLGKPIQGTKGGFCKSRDKIRYELFKHMHEFLLQSYGNRKEQKSWKGFKLKAIDGAVLDVVDTKDNREEFGQQVNQYGGVSQARMLIGYDVLNKLVTNCYIGKMSIGEGSVVKQWVSGMKKDELNIYDRLYPGMTLQYLHNYYETHYVMRCKLTHNKQVRDFVASNKKEKVEEWKLTNKAVTELKALGHEVDQTTSIKVRLVKVKLDSGETEVLISSLVDRKKYPLKLFKELYFKRWGVEVEIGFIKNTLQIEITSGRKPQTIYQDFFATIFRANVQALIEQDCEQELQQINARRKYDYSINRTAAAGNLKGELPKLFLSKNPKEIYFQMQKIFLYNLEPIRLQRQFPRIKKSQKVSGKYRPLKNYKRAV